MTRPVRRKAAAKADPGFDLFDADWPCSAWDGFQRELLAVVYERSSTLWPILRQACKEVTGTIEHQVYEGEIDDNRPFREAIPHIWSWSDAVPLLQQARSLLSRDEWQALLRPAPLVPMKPPQPKRGQRKRR